MTKKITLSHYIGLLFAAVHFLLFLIFSILMNFGSQDAMSGMLWGIWKTADFPVSLLAIYGFTPSPAVWDLLNFIKFIFPYFIHGVLGTIWWYLLPRILALVFFKDRAN